MNHFVHIVPWRSCSEFNEVRDWFFGPSKSQETLIKGLSRVSAWQVRGRVPHAVEATANLTCVLVQEERGTCDPLGLRLSYAMALTRFVNGFLDPEQQGQYAITMQTLARNIDLPLSFVEIRHAATHEQLPSLVLLRSMAIRALEWLLDKYWSKSSGNTIDLSGKPKEKRIEEILRNWEAFQEKNFNNSLENKVKDFDSKDISIMIKECIILCSSFGGDGTVLFSSWLFQRIVPPVISFSLGSLGFLTMFDFSMFDNTLDNIFNHGVIVSLRMRFKCTIMRVKVNNGQLVDEIKNLDQSILENKKNGMSVTHEPKESFLILNDLVVDRGPNAFLSSLELYGDYKHLTSVQADGICISTPTGSTAYSLSAGGSLCHPDIPAILISPILGPHTLSFRPLLVHDSMILHVAVPYNARSTAWVSFDGRNRVEIKQGDYVTISASRFPFPIVHRSKQSSDWFTGLATRLGWNERSMKPKPLSN
ncbi:unnamed protein product [Pneumocystis jirovecii]|uniref:Uncharacterized protein n=1 Tax=Pneumocystis jirovecii TaxID=42068 RepID=L0P8X8_PNEJI|nr:unnamed protein product [Pneumocystis jirovecii]